MTVVRRKLEQSADRDARGSKPERVPVTARLQLLPAQFRSSRTAAPAKENKDTKAASFMLAVVLTEMLLWRISWGCRADTGKVSQLLNRSRHWIYYIQLLPLVLPFGRLATG